MSEKCLAVGSHCFNNGFRIISGLMGDTALVYSAKSHSFDSRRERYE